MNLDVELALIAEGTSDKVLIQPIRWLCNDIQPDLSYEIEPIIFHDVSPKPDLTTKIEIVLSENRHQIILVHRDQDNMTRIDRTREIETAVGSAYNKLKSAAVLPCIPIIPVRMTEAWFLIDEASIKKAAGYPNNRVPLNLPSPRQLESVPDAKNLLYDKIRTASGHTGRKLKKVRPQQTIHTLADVIEDYSSLDQLPAFQTLRRDLTAAML